MGNERTAVFIALAVIGLFWVRSARAENVVYGAVVSLPDGTQTDFSSIDLSSSFSNAPAWNSDPISVQDYPIPDVSGTASSMLDFGSWQSETEDWSQADPAVQQETPDAGASLIEPMSNGPDFTNTVPATTVVTLDAAQQNVAAYLNALKFSEGVDRVSDPYRVVFGFGHAIQDMSNHPYFTGEWKGAAFGRGQWSTAAGAYQFLAATWHSLMVKLALPDFGPDSQDKAAVQLIRAAGALDDVMAGRFELATSKLNKIWASLPGSPYGQPTRTMEALLSHYQDNGGTVTA